MTPRDAQEPLRGEVPGTLAVAVDHLLAGNVDAARTAVASIDSTACQVELQQACRAAAETAAASAERTMASGASAAAVPAIDRRHKRVSVTAQTAAVMYRRDGYRCRYAHCRRRTVDARVVRALSKLLPDVLPYHAHWKFDDCHGLLWTDTASYEHVVPLARGGDNSSENIVTVCACCNYAKSSYTLEELGWELAPAPDKNEGNIPGWDGLISSLPALERLAAQVDNPP